MVTRELRRNLDKLSASRVVDFNYIGDNHKVERARNLLKKDIFGLSDPYVKVQFCGSGDDTFTPLSQSSSTVTVKRTLTPRWNQKLYFLTSSNQFGVILDVYDENVLTRDDHLGRVLLHMDFFHQEHSRPPVVQHPVVSRNAQPFHGWIDESSIRLYNIPIKKKYSSDVLTELYSLFHLPYVAQLKAKYRSKSSQQDLEKYRASGSLDISYCFLDPASPEARPLIDEIGCTIIPKMTITHVHRQSNVADQDAVIPQQLAESNLPYSTDNTMMVPQTIANPSTNDSSEEDVAVALGFEIIDNESSSDEDEPLPSGWERRVDSNGRRVFINHFSRTTSLRRPNHVPLQQPTRYYLPRLNSNDATLTHVQEDENEVESEVIDEHMTTYDNVVSPTPPAIPVTTDISESTLIPSQSPSLPPSQPSHTPLELKSHHLQQGLPDGWFVAFTPEGKTYYIDHKNKKTSWNRPKMQESRITRTYSDHVEQDDLPPGWEARKNAEGRIFYVNHTYKTTQWEHPREKQNDLGPLPSGWEMKTRKDGKVFFVDHTTKSTQWEDPRLLASNKPTHKMEYSRDYKQKYNNFISQLIPREQRSGQFKIPAKRSNIMESSYNAIMSASSEKLKLRLWVEFDGEHGLDYGGVSREWFHLISREMFNPYYGLFEYSASDDYTLQINPNSGIYNENHLDYFKFIGRVCGMAIYHKHLIDAFFIRPFYKMLLGRQITINDMESVDVELYNSVLYIKENDPEPLCLTFSVNNTLFGDILEEELTPGGKDIDVTEANKHEYIDLMIKWRFVQRVSKQMTSFKNGLSDVIPLHKLKVFDEREVEYLLGGLAQIDVADWKKHTEYSGYFANDQSIVWFWKAVNNFDDEMRARLLQFVTGTSKVPMNGFAELQGSNGPRKFCIKKLGNLNGLPRAHTCFNRVDLPPCSSYHRLKENLKLAIENTEGFEGVD